MNKLNPNYLCHNICKTNSDYSFYFTTTNNNNKNQNVNYCEIQTYVIIEASARNDCAAWMSSSSDLTATF